MTTLNKNTLLVFVCALALIAVPMAFAGIGKGVEDLKIGMILIIIELLIYFVAALVMNPKATIGMAFANSVLFIILRGFAAFIGVLAYGAISASMDSSAALRIWLNPISMVIQIVVILFAGPYILAILIPELLGKDVSDQLRGDTRSSAAPRKKAPQSIETNPAGGFIQVFSFDELEGVIKKTPGLEGYIIYNDEGLVVWHSLPLKIEVDSLTARLVGYCTQVGQLSLNSGLTKARRVVVENKEHHVLTTSLNQNFGMILMFSSRISQEEMYSRIGVLTKSTREYLQWKYPALPLATGLTKESAPLEVV